MSQKIMEGLNDTFILEMTECIGPTTKLISLAVELGFTIGEAEIFHEMNRMNGRVSTDGTRRMLCRWREKTLAENQWIALEAALTYAGLAGIAYEFSSMVEGRARPSVEIRNKRGAPEPDGDEKEPPHKRLIRDRFLEVRVQEQQHTLQEMLERRYTDPSRFVDEVLLQTRDFQPGLKRRDSSSALFYAMENSRHDIFLSPMAREHRRRITVSGSDTAKLTALCRSLAYDWATQNRASSVLLEQQLVFEVSANDMKPNQTIESAIKHQLFTDLDEVDEALIRQLLKDMPDAITILLDGFNDRNCGENIMDVLSGRTLQEVTVMVTTTQPRSANLLDRMGVYDRIDMY